VRKLRPIEEAYVPIISPPGFEGQVDFGYAGYFIKDGKKIKCWIFNMRLSYSVNANIKLIIIANIKVNSFDKEKYTILSIKYEENCNENRVRRGITYFEVFKNEA
jgi:hypothetical protein